MINHFIAIGGGGCNILQSILLEKPYGIFTMVSDPIRNNLPESIEWVHFIMSPNKPTIRAYPNDVEDLAIYQNLQIPIELIKRINRNQNIILISSLGGYTGTIFLDYLIQFLTENKYRFSVHCGWPLKFEGQARLNSAIKFRLKHLPTQKVTHYKSIIDETYEDWEKSSTIGDFLKKMNQQIANSIIKKH